MSKGNKPKYYLKLTDKRNTKQRTVAGVAFENEFKQLNIVLNPGVVIRWNDELFITLNPYDDKRPPPHGADMPQTKRAAPNDEDEEDKDSDDIPF